MEQIDKEIEKNRSKVRIFVTELAALYVFMGSAVFIAALWVDGLDPKKFTIAKDIFMTVLPVATGVITYWFASRKADKDDKERHEENNDKIEDTKQ